MKWLATPNSHNKTLPGRPLKQSLLSPCKSANPSSRHQPQIGRTLCTREGVSDGTVANAQPAARVTPGQFDRSMRWIPNPLGSRNRLRFLILSLKKPGKASDSHLCPRGIMTIVKNNLDSLPFLFLTIATTFPNFWTFQDGIAGETFRSPAKS